MLGYGNLDVVGISVDSGQRAGRVSLILGAVWTLWHLPLLATGTTEFHGLASFVKFATTTAVRILHISESRSS